MRISEIYVYPIKSLRGVRVTSADATRTGFKYDRRFMLLKVVPSESGNDGETTLKNMHVPRFPEMALFETELFKPSPENKSGTIRVKYNGPSTQANGSGKTVTGGGPAVLDVPLTPEVRGLEELAIVMHNSPTKGYNMGQEYNRWFSEHFGYEVVLAYLPGTKWRGVLGTFAPGKHAAHKDYQRHGLGLGLVGAVLVLLSGVLMSTTSLLTVVADSTATGMGVVVAGALGVVYSLWKLKGVKDEKITFADTAPYLVVSETSVANVSSRLDGEEMDVKKFRANIVVEGAKSAFEEDYWAEIMVGQNKVRLLLTANCVRCRSLDVDYTTGKMGGGESGNVLKKLMADRRVDRGAKYNPVFGRYGFLDGQSDSKAIQVGDEVVVARTMKERAVYDWPGLA